MLTFLQRVNGASVNCADHRDLNVRRLAAFQGQAHRINYIVSGPV